jgi:5-methylcytosine-specific restriction endonuclease McrA
MSPAPPPPDPAGLAGFLLACLLLSWLLRRLASPHPDALARAAEVRAYGSLVRRAGGLLERGRLTDAKVLIDERLWEMRATSRRSERSRHIPSEVRREVWERDGGCCCRCGATEELQFDHIIPWSEGGAHSAENLELLCGRCNRRKAARIE